MIERMVNFRIILFGLTLIVLSCKPIGNDELINPEENAIVYLFHNNEIEELFLNELIKIDARGAYFHIKSNENGFTIYMGINLNAVTSKSQRKFLIGENLYPILIDEDLFFSTTDSFSEVLDDRENLNAEDIIRWTFIPNHEDDFRVVIDRDKKILSYGYGNNN